MNIVELPISILDNIIRNINDTDTYSNLRLSCKSFYYLSREVKRYYNNKAIKELFMFGNGSVLNGYHIKWYINTKVSSMILYQHSRKHGEHTYYYPSGNIKCIQEWKNGKLNGFERYYNNAANILVKFIEYKDNVKVNEELIYNKQSKIIFRKLHLNKEIYKMTFNHNEYKIIEGTFVNNKLHGNLIVTYLNPNNLSYIKYNKYVYNYDNGVLKSVNTYYNNNLLEKISIKKGKKYGWAYKWHHSHKLKCLSYFNQNKYEKSIKLWDDTGRLTESLSFIDNLPNGVYKAATKYTTKIIPYLNGDMHGIVKEQIHCINLSYNIAFLKNQFAHTVNKTNDIFREEIYLDIDYFSFTKYRFNKKIYSFRLMTNYMELTIYDKHEVCIYTYSKIIHFNECTEV
jgi:antitoxin component YwqK of YwqJK toxin-antitoxin module